MKLNKMNSIAAYDASKNNIDDISISQKCYCYACLKEIDSNDIKKYDGTAAMCPVCNQPTLIPDAIGFKIDEEFLKFMNKTWL